MSPSSPASLPARDRPPRSRPATRDGGDLPEADVDRELTRSAPRRPGPRRPPLPSLEPDHPVGQPPRLVEVVGDQDAARSRARARSRVRVASTASRAAWSSAEVGSSSSSTRGCRASARASITRCCSPTESFADVAIRRTQGRGPASSRQRARVEAVAGEPRRRRRCCLRRCPRAAPAAGARGQTSRRSGERVALAHVVALVDDRPASGSASRLSSRSSVDLPLPEGPTTQLAPTGSRR